MQDLLHKIKKAFYALKEKGIRFTYNLFWLNTFYVATDNFLRNLLYLKIFPLFKFAPYPTSIEIEISTKCNLKCIMCEHTYWSELPQDMSFKEVRVLSTNFRA